MFYVASGNFTSTGSVCGTTCRHLEAAPTDYKVGTYTRTPVAWGCLGVPTGATATAIGTGKANTTAILTKCKTVGIAADVANKYSTSTAAAGQWFLPSRDELNELCKYARQTGQVAGGGVLCYGEDLPPLRDGFNDSGYWGSSEYGAYDAVFNTFGSPSMSWDRGSGLYVRPVRAF